MDARTLSALVAIPLVALLATASCTRQDPSPVVTDNATEGERLMRQMSDLLAKTPTFRFATAESLEPAGAPARGRVLRFTRTVTVRRPNAMVFDLDGTGETAADISAFYDGTAVSLRNNADGTWARTAVPGTLDGMLDDVANRYSLPVPIADVVYSAPYDAFIGTHTKGGVAGREMIDGVDHTRMHYGDHLLDVHVWLPTSGPPLPRRIELVYKYVPGAPKSRIDFTSWDLDPQVTDATFAFTPGRGEAERAFESFVAGLLVGRQAGPPAPGAPQQ